MPPCAVTVSCPLFELRLQGQMTMTLSAITTIIAPQDSCGGGKIGNDRGLFEPFSFLDLKIKELEKMKNSKLENPGRLPTMGWDMFAFVFSQSPVGLCCLQVSAESFLCWGKGTLSSE